MTLNRYKALASIVKEKYQATKSPHLELLPEIQKAGAHIKSSALCEVNDSDL